MCGGECYEGNAGSVGTGGWQRHLARAPREDLSDRMACGQKPKELKKVSAFPWIETNEDSMNAKRLGSAMPIHFTKPSSTELAHMLDLGSGFI